MSRPYKYVGPRRLADLAMSDIERAEPKSEAEFALWLSANYNEAAVTLTYVVTRGGALRVSDRHSEHVACARGEAVLGAGELSLLVDGDAVEVESVTNQSTGYCPEPDCFPEVAAALAGAGLVPPAGFSHEFLFRRCTSCLGINLVKDGDFECATCGVELPRRWNFADDDVQDRRLDGGAP